MRLFNIFALLPLLPLLMASPLCAQVTFGSSGEEGEPFRRQQWRVPSPDTEIAAHALLFRPVGAGPFRLAVIAHASTQNVLRRAQMPQPEYRALVAFLIARDFAVLVPERLGHGATGGRYVEDQGGCDEADYARSGRATAAEISLALDFLRKQDFVRQDKVVVLGHSAGGWGALALANADPNAISAIIALAPGRGGHANDEPNRICAPQTLVAAAAGFGKAARIPVTWLVATNDSYFAPAFSRQLADAFRGGGGRVDFRTLPAVGSEGHWMIESEAGVKAASRELGLALNEAKPTAAKKP
ncbi:MULTISPECIES: alpha/beta hydrolase family protein [Bradyrhizobium]|uniref:alpha/beta hydrolase family protein n=1 Tax=Bradyrhizobium TaxID=374 RepID=UPI000231BFD6|nr:alpha/beta fold hydrolase [Bradyrhizobium japonicum]AJA59412.1 peptidase [Bradyrhizobium japonicum]KMJ97524.1 peptidase [Bradyrhizobium japonicum]MBR0729033.1 alpha/beta fold hydrolase [Bradyrhizobium japonicum]MBR0761918.1 alpha/beta fold hydrolase [Bradyrhizobium japonicum]MBR0804194.1 alpha/beta fold hydrolase [Bradyrhizobium japonicum]